MTLVQAALMADVARFGQDERLEIDGDAMLARWWDGECLIAEVPLV